MTLGEGCTRSGRTEGALMPRPSPSHYPPPSARCISKAWVCDGDSDCEDNSDEENCEALACRPPSHPCANNTSVCLPPNKLCDGKDDCGDGSDEGELCGEAPGEAGGGCWAGVWARAGPRGSGQAGRGEVCGQERAALAAGRVVPTWICHSPSREAVLHTSRYCSIRPRKQPCEAAALRTPPHR